MAFPVNWASLWIKGFRYFISFNPHNHPMRKVVVIISIVQMKRRRCWRMTQGHRTVVQKLSLWPRAFHRHSTSESLPSQGKPRALLGRRAHPVRRVMQATYSAVTSSLTHGTLNMGKPKSSFSKTALVGNMSLATSPWGFEKLDPLNLRQRDLFIWALS